MNRAGPGVDFRSLFQPRLKFLEFLIFPVAWTEGPDLGRSGLYRGSFGWLLGFGRTSCFCLGF